MVAVIALSVAILGCGGGGNGPSASEGASDAARRQTRFLNDGAFGKQWDELHPAQQANVDKLRYVNCAEALPHSAGTVVLLNVRDEPITIDDVPATQATVVVLKTADSRVTTTAREVRVDDRWRWVLANDAYRALKAGRCPA